jgi:uncharacterized membrane protein YhhN
MINASLFIPVIMAGFDWLAISRGSKWEYLTKPGAMVSLLIWVFVTGNAADAAFPWGGLIWFVIGGIASTFGDIFLMLPKEQFILGLVSFALGHIAYVIGLNTNPLDLNLAAWIVLGLVVVVGIRIFKRIQIGLVSKDKAQLVGPVLFYTVVISLMLISAMFTLTGQQWPTGPALLVSLGALLFFISDTLLSWNRFVAPISGEKLKVRVTYHLGQIGILAGAAIYFLATANG